MTLIFNYWHLYQGCVVICWAVTGSQLVQSEEHSRQRRHHPSKLCPEKGRSQVRRETQPYAVSITMGNMFVLLHHCHKCTPSFISVWTKCWTALPPSLLFPAEKENVVFISKVRRSIKRWKFRPEQSFGFYYVFSWHCLAATEARTSCALHLNQALWNSRCFKKRKT